MPVENLVNSQHFIDLRPLLRLVQSFSFLVCVQNEMLAR